MISGEFMNCQCHRRIWHVHDGTDMFFVEPLCCSSGGDIDLVFVVTEKHPDFPAKHFPPEIFNGHAGSNDGALSGNR